MASALIGLDGNSYVRTPLKKIKNAHSEGVGLSEVDLKYCRSGTVHDTSAEERGFAPDVGQLWTSLGKPVGLRSHSLQACGICR